MAAARRGRTAKVLPDPPEVPDRWDQAPDTVESGAVWDGVEPGPDTVVPEQIADLDIHESRWVDADLSGRRFTGLRCRDTQFASLRMAQAKYLLVEDTVLRGADFYQLTGTGCGLIDCDLTGASFADARLTGLRLHRSVLDDVGGALALRGARISPDQLVPMGAALAAALDIQVSD